MNSNFVTPKSHTCDDFFSNRKMTNDTNKSDQRMFSYNRPSSLFMYPSLQTSAVYPFPTSRASSTSSFYPQLSNPLPQQQYSTSSSSTTTTAAASAQQSSSSSSSFSSAVNPSTSSSLSNLYNINCSSSNHNGAAPVTNNNYSYADNNSVGATLQPFQYKYFPHESSQSRPNTTSIAADSLVSETLLKNNTGNTKLPSILSSSSASSSASSASTSSLLSYTSLSSASSLLSTNSMFKQGFLKPKTTEETNVSIEAALLSPKSEEVNESGKNTNSEDYTRCRRKRKKAFEVERHYKCNYPFCDKAYGTLNHLNTHILIQKHGKKRLPQEFSQLRKQLRKRKRESLKAMKLQSQLLNQGLGYGDNQNRSNHRGSPFSSATSSLIPNSASSASSSPTLLGVADSRTSNTISMPSSSAAHVSSDLPNGTIFSYGYKNIGYNFGVVNDEEIYNSGNNLNSGSYLQYYDPYERDAAFYQPKYMGYAGMCTQRYGKENNSFLQPPNCMAATSGPGTATPNFCIIGHNNNGGLETGFSNTNFYCDKLE